MYMVYDTASDERPIAAFSTFEEAEKSILANSKSHLHELYGRGYLDQGVAIYEVGMVNGCMGTTMIDIPKERTELIAK